MLLNKPYWGAMLTIILMAIKGGIGLWKCRMAFARSKCDDTSRHLLKGNHVVHFYSPRVQELRPMADLLAELFDSTGSFFLLIGRN
ncbi:hypothetical protein RBA41_03275 [Massilia sp. CCM 9210]|uniref:hypothetical protein n=1 Tax=Massilia scottii TaxID=3057166 RepID=UPI002796ADFA|nr:hypothetical protein [Massilia sp. CCM 9210]MDQ1812316.1 hypothetical protein [Massilia sp. CCM 9210]